MMVDPDGNWAWMAVGGALGGYSSYKWAKKKKLKGWKKWGAVAGGAALGAVGGGSWRTAPVSRHWYKGTFKTAKDSLNYHHGKYVINKGKTYSKRQYTKMAKNFYKQNKSLREEVTLKTGKKGYRIKNGKQGGFYTRNDKIVSYWNNGWKKVKKIKNCEH
ncbi:hypothetical protein [Bacillus sp. REN10]|uniref:hypothetical protein n=1 Tax=Bacillus sp. REN10 TaxID=2782541 RepID=UPI00193B7950|nr:hypothetical protein [Bacillus sp. REN10]